MKREENTCLYLYLRLLQLNKGNIKTLNIFIFAKTKLLPLSLFLRKPEPIHCCTLRILFSSRL